MDILSTTLEKKIPFVVQINLTRRCNLHCIHCCVCKENCSQELTYDEVCGIVDQLAQAGTLLLTFSGGEVMLRDDLTDIIEYTRRLNFAVKIFTNGTLLHHGVIERLRNVHVQEVDVSLYSMTPETHDRITGVSGSWERTASSIRQLSREGVGIKIKCPLMRQNVGDYRSVYEFARQMGTGYAFDPLITARDDGARDALNLRIDQEDLRKIFQDPIFNNERTIEGIENISCLINAMHDEVPCSAGHNICYISPEGDVTPCVQLPISCGNLREHDFEWIWRKSPTMLQLRSIRMGDIRGCDECHYMPWCARCPGLAYLEDGDLLGPSSAACWMAEARGDIVVKI